jgi:hypothetical protein
VPSKLPFDFRNPREAFSASTSAVIFIGAKTTTDFAGDMLPTKKKTPSNADVKLAGT